MSSNQKEKLAQVVQNFFLKATNTIVRSRTSIDDSISRAATANNKVNKWFNLETYDIIREDMKLWKSITSNFPPLVIEIYLDLRELTLKQSLLLKDENKNSYNLNTNKSEIVLERWLVEFDTNTFDKDEDAIELPLLYKKLIILLRYLYTVTRLLPTYKLLKRFSKTKLLRPSLRVGNRVLDGNRPIISRGRIGLSKPIIQTGEEHLIQKIITPIRTTSGTFRISVSYRRNYDFRLGDNEEALSSHFINIDRTRAPPIISPTATTTPAAAIPLRKAFKSGTASPPPSGSPLGRTGSNASLVQTLRNQRAGSIGAQSSSIPRSIASSVGSVAIPANELGSGGSTPKYSSSFGKIARRSSIRRSSSIDQGASSSVGTPSSLKNASGGVYVDEEINDFMKLIDSKQDLKLKFSPNIEDSLGRFQSMKNKNDVLTESLSASVYSKSHSQSPSPLIGQQVQKQPQQQQPQVHQNVLGTSFSPRNIYLPTIQSKLSAATSSSESLLLNDHVSRQISPSRSSSPASISAQRRVSRSFSIGPSNPSIGSSNVHAIVHRGPSSSVDSITGRVRSVMEHRATEEECDDDDLLFTMSDMNVSK